MDTIAPAPRGAPTAAAASEGMILFLVGAVNFVNILDFVMVMPLGPDFAKGLGIPQDRIGLVAAAYTGAAAISGLAGAGFLDRFDRRKVLAVAMIGLVIGTALGGAATGLGTMIAARALAGAFGGPATSLAMSIVADVIPAERRGKALGTLMASFSVASVLGVPAALEVSRVFGWRAPFLSLAALAVVVAGLGLAFLPPMTGHLARDHGEEPTFRDLAARPLVRAGWAATGVLFMASFIVIPNIPTYLQENLDYPRDDFWLLYLAGGSVSFFVTQAVGRLVDRFGGTPINVIGNGLFVVVILGGFVLVPPWIPPLPMFVLFMTAMGFRNLSFTTTVSRVPLPAERARFASFQSAIQHLGTATAAALATALVHEQPDHTLQGMRYVAFVSIALTCTVPPMLWWIERRVR